jgi:hypothetical protein
MADTVDPREQTIARLLDVAGLPSSPERVAVLVPQFEAWLDGSRELCQKMSAPAYQEVTPITVLTHPAIQTGE